MEVIKSEIIIKLDLEDQEKLDFLLVEASKSDNLSEYDKEFLINLRMLLKYIT